MRHYFILNPAAGKGAALRLIPAIREAFQGEDFILHQSAAPGEATEYVRGECRLHQGEALRFYACGGDGTVNEVARGLLEAENAALGVVPCGSGNDLVKSFPGRDFLDLWAQRAGETVPMDLMEFCGRTAVNLCNCGLDADVAHNMPLFRRLPGVSGSMAYQLSILYTFFRPLGKAAEIRLDEEPPIRAEALLLLCGNGRYYGGGYQGAPLAQVDDGLLDVCLVPKLGRLKILSILGKYQKGLHVSDPELSGLVTYRKVRRLEASFAGPVTMCLDGETFQGEQMSARILPAAIRLVLPAQGADTSPPC
ncbi:MAG: YegS/Rv2252/BmrU family lipid kinase [Angelakisella sp.]|nr:YegS/Rv2252/BmrU family lipid kinase [Angelakisella sp.]